MITVYQVYNKFDNYLYTETLSETEAYRICASINNAHIIAGVSPWDLPWGICSRIMADSYAIKLQD
jgi:hypothetical protein